VDLVFIQYGKSLTSVIGFENMIALIFQIDPDGFNYFPVVITN